MAAFFHAADLYKVSTPAQYGYSDLYTAYITFFCSILFSDVWGAVMRFMFDYNSGMDKAKPITVGEPYNGNRCRKHRFGSGVGMRMHNADYADTKIHANCSPMLGTCAANLVHLYANRVLAVALMGVSMMVYRGNCT